MTFLKKKSWYYIFAILSTPNRKCVYLDKASILLKLSITRKIYILYGNMHYFFAKINQYKHQQPDI